MITFTRIEDYGRLGNQMFQIAATIGIATKNGFSYGFNDWSYQKYFENSLPKKEGNFPNNFSYNDFCFNDITIQDNTNIFGYFQSWKFFSEVDIKSIFKPSSESLKAIEHYNFNNSISIHIRRGDYLRNTHVYPILSLDYYKRAVSMLESSGCKDWTIYIFSDDIEWCKSNFNFTNQIFVEQNSDILELFMMSKCNHNIISNSTFSWWAAYLNNNTDKKITCPNVWFNNVNEISNFVFDDLIPNDWIRIDI